MFKFIPLKDQEAERAQQVKDLKFNWHSKRLVVQEKLQEYADIIYERVADQVQAFNPINLLFSTSTGQIGKTIRFKQNFGGRVYTRSYGEIKKASPIKANFYTISTSPKALHLFWPIEDIKAGIILTSEMVDMATKAILHYRMKMMWDTLKAAIPTGSATNVGASFSQTGVLAALNSLGDVCPVQAIIGRRSFLGNIVTFTGYDGATGFSENLKNEIDRTGWVSQYAGVTTVGLEAFYDDLTGEAAIDAGNAFIIGAKTKNWNRFVEVTPLSSSYEAIARDNTWHLYFDFEDGFAVWKTTYMKRLWDGSTQ